MNLPMNDQNCSQKLKVMQLNCSRAYSTMHNMRRAREQGFDMILISEPYIGELNKLNMVDTSLFIDKSTSEPKAAICVFNTALRCTPVTIKQHMVAIKLVNHDIIIYSHYIPPKQTTEVKELVNQFISRLDVTAKRTLHCGDFNGRSKNVLCDHSTNPRGTKIVNQCIRNGWTILNQPSVPTFTGFSKQDVAKFSIVDLAICTPDLEHLITWSTMNDPEYIDIDHVPIELSITINDKETPSERTGYRPTKFINTMKKSMSISPENWYQNLTNALKQSEKPNIREYKGWKMSAELKLFRSEIDDLAKFIRRRNLPRDSIDHRTLRNMSKKYKSMVKRERAEAFDKFLSELTENETFKSCWKWVRKGTNNSINCIDDSGDTVYGFEEIANTTLKHFYPDEVDQSEKFNQLFSTIDDDPPFTIDEIRKVVNSFGNSKAPGSDNMSVKLMKTWFRRDPSTIEFIANKMLGDMKFPPEYKDYRIILLKKKPKLIPKVSECRPIGLGCILSKVLEKLIINRIYYYARRNNYLTDTQHGFTDGKSCITALSQLQNALDDNSRHKMCFSIDIKGAFNNIHHDAIIKALIECKCPHNIVELWKDYLTGRTVHMAKHNVTVVRNMFRGCVQGSPGGPLNFILAVNSIIKEIEHEINEEKIDCKLVIFADDCSGIVSTDIRNPDAAKANLITIVSHIITKFQTKLQRVGLEVAPEKTQIVFIYESFIPTFIRHGDTTLVTQKSCKILGLTIKHDGDYHDHVMMRISKAKAAITSLMKYCRSQFGLNQHIRTSIIKKAIIPMVSYASSVWYNKIGHSTLKEIKLFNKWVTITITGAHWSTSFASSLVIGKHPPIHHDLPRRALLEQQVTQGLSIKYGVPLRKKATVKERCHPGRTFFVTMNDRIRDSSELEKINGYDLYIFTDGSKLGKPGENVGASIVYSKKSSGQVIKIVKLKLPCYVTSYHAELIAIDHALFVLITQHIPGEKICLCTDSLSSLMAMENPHAVDKTVINIQKMVAVIKCSHKIIEFYHVSGHKGIKGNEIADKLANSARLTGDPHRASIDRKVIKNEGNDQMKINIDDEYLSDKWGRTIKKFFPKVSSPMREIAVFNKHTVKIYTGHGFFRNYLFERKFATNDKCPCDVRSVQDVEHILFHCPLMMDIKNKHRSKARLTLPIRAEYWDDLNNTIQWHNFINLVAKEINILLIIMHNEYENTLGDANLALDNCYS